VLSARGEKELERVAREVRAAGGEAVVSPGDVTDEAYRARLVALAVREKGHLDVLVNNAGRGFRAATRDIDVGKLADLFALNVIAPLRLTQLAEDVLARTKGCVVMISSVAGVVSSPHMGAYAASKFALEALATAMRAEMREKRIRVLVVRPGPVDTPFRDHAESTEEARYAGRPRGAHVQSATEVAEQTIRAVERRRAVLETTSFVKVASLAARVTPGIFRAMAAWMAR
jgi:short-subunit dehydrogenase